MNRPSGPADRTDYDTAPSPPPPEAPSGPAPTRPPLTRPASSGSNQAPVLTLEELRALVDTGDIDTVVVAATDIQGRLQGKRLGARFFLEEALQHGTEGCDYLLAVDVDMTTVSGYEMSSWTTGYGDIVFVPDLGTLRHIPWQPGTALVICDLQWPDGRDVVASPRQILAAQVARLEALGLEAFAGTELEFITFDTGYEQAQLADYRDLRPSNLFNVDYSLLGTARVEPLLREIRNAMAGAGMYVEGSKGECNFGQHEITFRYDDVMTTCDNHSLYKNGAKEIAAQHGKSITFMAKYNQLEGSSCHIHMSLRSAEGDFVLPGEREHGFSTLMEHFIAGQLACLEDFTYFFAPNINSYKRYVEGSFAPTSLTWGTDNRTCALRVVGHGPSLRVEMRVGGADLNPYLATAALIAAGLHGIENKLTMPGITRGNAYDAEARSLPTHLRAARDLLSASQLAKDAFGEEVVRHYVSAADVELAAFESAVTDWERRRGFERL